MPVILHRADEDAWICRDLEHSPADLLALLKPILPTR
jgi:hypothetical protein